MQITIQCQCNAMLIFVHNINSCKVDQLMGPVSEWGWLEEGTYSAILNTNILKYREKI